MARNKHPRPEIEAALRYAEEHGWRIEVGGSHAWGKMYCPYNDKDCRCGEFCIASIWSTPKNAGNHARQIRRVVNNCKRLTEPEDDANEVGNMNEYEFVLKFSLPEATNDPEAFVARLAEAGCDDALVGIGQTGRVALDFTREASSALEAIATAIKDVKRAIPKAQLVEATPDLVGLTDVADILGFSRQNMRKLVFKNQDFPPPLHEGKPSIWHLAKILYWFDQKKTYTVNPTLLEVADANMQFNITREAQSLEPSIQRGLKALVV